MDDGRVGSGNPFPAGPREFPGGRTGQKSQDGLGWNRGLGVAALRGETLTPKQREILDFIQQQAAQKGYPPSVREICQALGLKSTSTVHGHLARLARKGYIRRDPSKPRAIEVLRRDDDTLRPAEPDGIPGGLSARPRESYWIPLVGRVTAGQPILAVENVEGWIPLSPEWAKHGRLFALRVRGDSMRNAGILDGDWLVVRRQETAENGDIVVALIDDEATVKRFYKEANAIRLQPENEAYPPIITRRASILGKVVALFRDLA